jgi:hypothetical protein
MFLTFGVILSCEDKINAPEWPQWPNISQPKIDNAKLTGKNGETEITAGSSFRFTANLTDEYNELATFELNITINNKTVFQQTVQLTGKEAAIDMQGRILFTANFEDHVKPIVKMKAVNNEIGGTTEITLPETANLTVNRPATPTILYAVDNLEQVFAILPIEGKEYDFETSADLSTIGQSFKIAERLTPDNKIDYSGIVWGMKDGEIVTIENEAGSPIPVPNIITKIVFNVYTFLVSGGPATTIDKAAFTASEYAGYFGLTLLLSKNEELEFVGFGDNIITMLRPDYFKNIDGQRANFDGYTETYTLLYNESNGFMYIENKTMTLPGTLWMCGTGLGFPRSPYTAPSEWNWNKPTDYVFCKKINENIFEAVIYISNNFGFKFFTRRNWESTEYPEYKAHNFTVTPAELIQSHKWTEITWDGNGDLIPGPAFTPGVYKIEMNLVDSRITLEPYNE